VFEDIELLIESSHNIRLFCDMNTSAQTPTYY